MIIQSHDIQLDSSRLLVQHHEKEEQLRVWNNNSRLEISNREEETNIKAEAFGNRSALIDISKEGMAKFLESANKKLPIKAPAEDLLEEDDMAPSQFQLMKMILEKFFGIKIEIITPGEEGEGEGGDHETAPAQGRGQAQPAQPPQQQQSWGLQYSYHEVNYQKETVNFSAAGKVTTADGREINFAANLEMSKETLQRLDVEIRLGDALKDPLALNFDGKGLSLTDEKYQFDLNMDGQAENISFLERGSGFLVLDKNQNGIVDDGSELFGPATNNGFLELKAYDEDNNDWIDENDAIYYQLNIWTKNDDGSDNLANLQAYDVGAIYLNSAKTQFDLEEGQLKESGIYLKENGAVNFIQEVDLKVT